VSLRQLVARERRGGSGAATMSDEAAKERPEADRLRCSACHRRARAERS